MRVAYLGTVTEIHPHPAIDGANATRLLRQQIRGWQRNTVNKNLSFQQYRRHDQPEHNDWHGDSNVAPGHVSHEIPRIINLLLTAENHCGYQTCFKTHPVSRPAKPYRDELYAPQHFLYFFPLPHGHGVLRPTFFSTRRGATG
jgi:hypothetical protein